MEEIKCNEISHILCGVEVLFLWKVLCIAQPFPTRYDGDFHEWVSIPKKPTHDRMPCLMVGYHLLLFWLDDQGPLLEAANDPLNGLFKVGEFHSVGKVTSSDQSGFIAHICHISTRKSGSASSQLAGCVIQIQQCLEWF